MYIKFMVHCLGSDNQVTPEVIWINFNNMFATWDDIIKQ